MCSCTAQTDWYKIMYANPNSKAVKLKYEPYVDQQCF